MKAPVVIIGVGEMGGVFARGFLRNGHPVCPGTRDMDMQQEADSIPLPQLTLPAVAEKDLHDTLDRMPAPLARPRRPVAERTAAARLATAWL